MAGCGEQGTKRGSGSTSIFTARFEGWHKQDMSRRTYWITVSLLILGLTAASLLMTRGEPVVVKTNLENLPMQIGSYSAISDSFDPSVYDELNADTHVYRHYISPEHGTIDLYIGYYGTAKGGRTGHNPYACLPGGGWAILETHPFTIRAKGSGKTHKVNYILSKKSDVYQVVLHWYQSNGDRVLFSGLEQNIHRFWGLLLHNRNDGAFVRLTATSHTPDTQDAEARLKRFAEDIINLLPRYWPEEALMEASSRLPAEEGQG